MSIVEIKEYNTLGKINAAVGRLRKHADKIGFFRDRKEEGAKNLKTVINFQKSIKENVIGLDEGNAFLNEFIGHVEKFKKDRNIKEDKQQTKKENEISTIVKSMKEKPKKEDIKNILEQTKEIPEVRKIILEELIKQLTQGNISKQEFDEIKQDMPVQINPPNIVLQETEAPTTSKNRFNEKKIIIKGK